MYTVHVLMERRDTINQVTVLNVIVLYEAVRESIYFINLVQNIAQLLERSCYRAGLCVSSLRSIYNTLEGGGGVVDCPSLLPPRRTQTPSVLPNKFFF
jgi:hypothetical protein